MKPGVENVKLWKKHIMDALDMYGYTMSRTAELNESLHTTYKKDDETLTVRTYPHGEINLSTDDVFTLFDSIVPHLEQKLNRSFGYDMDEEFKPHPHVVDYHTNHRYDTEKKYKYLPTGTYTADYLTRRERNVNYPTWPTRSSKVEGIRRSDWMDLQVPSLLSAPKRAMYSGEVARLFFRPIHDDMLNLKRKLASTSNELRWLKTNACRVHKDVVTYKDKTKEKYNDALYPTNFFPSKLL